VWEETRKAVVYVTHSIDEAIVLGNSILVMTARPGRPQELLRWSGCLGASAPSASERARSMVDCSDASGGSCARRFHGPASTSSEANT
jgi:ABC-type nitrate/sulfonate/bicarbonate transport system ATPase subunit